MKKKYKDTLSGLFFVFAILIILVSLTATEFLTITFIVCLFILVIFTGLSIHDALDQIELQMHQLREKKDS